VKALLVAAAIAAAVFGISVGVLEGGLVTPTSAERLALRELDALGKTWSRGALIRTGSVNDVVSCRRLSSGTFAVRVEGRELRVSDVHVRARPAATPEDVGAAVLTGVHRLYSRLLTVRLANRDVDVRRLSFAGHPAYALRLSRGRPEAELVIDRRTLAPLGAIYRSRALTGSSRFLPGRAGTGC
jgi:hypothetical protein